MLFYAACCLRSKAFIATRSFTACEAVKAYECKKQVQQLVGGRRGTSPCSCRICEYNHLPKKVVSTSVGKSLQLEPSEGSEVAVRHVNVHLLAVVACLWGC